MPTYTRSLLGVPAALLGFAAVSAGASGATAGQAPTFNKHVAPILYKSCAGCHRPGDIAPMSLLTWKEARPWAASIREAVRTRTMPPWHADAHYGVFANDPRLSEAEIRTIEEWVRSGAKEGDPKDLPAQPAFNDDWKIGKPDAVLDIGQDYAVENRSVPDEYTYFTIDPGFTSDVWVKAVELRPGNRKVVHHAHVWFEGPDSLKTRAPKKETDKPAPPSYIYKDEQGLSRLRMDAPVLDNGCVTEDGGNLPGRKLNDGTGPLGSYLPGKEPDVYPEGTAKLIPAGSKIKFQLHYNNTGKKPEVDRTQVGLIFAKEPPKFPLRRVDSSAYLFLIPPGASNHEVSNCTTFQKDVQLLSYVAHMHYRGKDMRFEIERPGGKRETLLFVPSYSFAWQQIYRLKEPVRVEKGTRLIVTAHFDNSANNKWNPDPTKPVRWGEPSTSEMMDGWVEYVDVPAAEQSSSEPRTASVRE